VAETESINRASDGREIGRDGLGAVVAGEWRCRRISPTGSAGLGSRPGRRGRYAPVTPPLRCRYAPVTRPLRAL